MIVTKDIVCRGSVIALLAMVGFVPCVSAQEASPVDALKAMAVDVSTTPDVARAVLLGTKLLRPDLESAPYLAQLNDLADEYQGMLQGVTLATDAVNILSNYLFNVKGFANRQMVAADVFVGLDQVLEGQQWNCVAMALLYEAIGTRAGVPLSVVSGHGHVFVAYAGANPFYIETMAGGRLEESRDYLREFLPFPCIAPASYVVLSERETIAMALTQMALAVQERGRTEQASELFNLALAFDPEHAEAHGGLAFIHAAAGRYEQAVAGFERAVTLNPDFREAYGGLGNARNALGDSERAVEAYRTMVTLCPDDPDALYNMAQILYEAGDLDGAIIAGERYIELRPEDPDGYMQIAFPLEDNGNMERAAEAYRRVLQLDPDNVDALANVAYIQEQVGEFELALADYDRALAIQPAHLQAQAGAGRVLGELGRFDQALRVFKRVLQQYPQEAFLWVDLGRMFEAFGEYRQAVSAYQEAIRLAPEDTEGYYELAAVMDVVGLNENALQIRAQARALEEELARREAETLPELPPFNGAPELMEPPATAGAESDEPPAADAPETGVERPETADGMKEGGAGAAEARPGTSSTGFPSSTPVTPPVQKDGAAPVPENLPSTQPEAAGSAEREVAPS